MGDSKLDSWVRFQEFYSAFPKLGLILDLSRVDFPHEFFSSITPRMEKAFNDMKSLEKGDIANPDEKRMVGHYWLRNSALAPTFEIRKEIDETLAEIKAFADKVHAGQVHGHAGPVKNLLLIGIGGSALGPQFVSHALGQSETDKLTIFFFDNTDPDGIDNTLSTIGRHLGQTLSI